MKGDVSIALKNINFSNEFSKRNIKPSHQRIQILEYLLSNRNHPTADQIFNDLKKEMPTLSKATVYNTIKAFIQAKLLREITIEDNEVRYDIQISDHGHFKCENCGKIYDFDIDIDNIPAADLNGFQIYDKNVYFKGICKQCLEYKNKINI
jgi:Fe2+ or Zn2+ uptake regulation protein